MRRCGWVLATIPSPRLSAQVSPINGWSAHTGAYSQAKLILWMAAPQGPCNGSCNGKWGAGTHFQASASPACPSPPHLLDRDPSAAPTPPPCRLPNIPTQGGLAPAVAVKLRSTQTPPAPDATLGGPGREVGTGHQPSLPLHRPAPARHQGSPASLASRLQGGSLLWHPRPVRVPRGQG